MEFYENLNFEIRVETQVYTSTLPDCKKIDRNEVDDTRLANYKLTKNCPGNWGELKLSDRSELQFY